MGLIIRLKLNKQVPDHSSGTSRSDVKEKSSCSPEYACSTSTSDCQENSPSSGLKSSPVISDGQRISPSTSDDQRKSPIISDSLKNSSSTSEKSYVVVPPGWSKTARRGRKSLSTSGALSDAALSSIEKQNEPPFGEKELVDTMMHLWSLAHSLNLANPKKDSITRSPKKRKLEDILCTENGWKKARIENQTANHMDEIILGSVKKTDDLEVIRKQTPVYSSASDKFRCDNCGRPFRSPQALGGHKSSCNIYFRKNEAGESSAQGSMRNKKNKIDEHQCRLCTKSFPSGQALGGHQREHRSALVSSSSVSQPMNISVDSLCPINSSTSVEEAQDSVPNKMNINVDSLFPINSSTTVEEAQDDVMNKKIHIMFDLNEVPPEDEDELNLKL